MSERIELGQLREVAARNLVCLVPPAAGILTGFLVLLWTKAMSDGVPHFDPVEFDVYLQPSLEGIPGVVRIVPLLGTWALSVLVLNMMSVVVFAISITSILRSLEINSTRIGCKVVAAVLMPFATYIMAVRTVPAWRHGFVGRDMPLSEKFNAIIEARTGLSWVQEMLSLEKIVLVTSCCVSAVAVGALLFNSRAAGPPTVVVLRHRMFWARIILYAVGIYTLMGVFHLRVWAQLPSLWMDDAGGNFVTQMATGIAAYGGVSASLVQSAIYVPAYLILHHRAVLLAENLNPGASVARRNEWLVENGLATSPLKASMSILAALGPFLASGPLRTFIGGLLEFGE